MTLKDKLMEDFKSALKSNDLIAKDTIQMVRAAILNEEKSKLETLTDMQVEDIVVKEFKKRCEAVAQFEQANRKDLVEKTNKEINVLNRYLPQQMSEFDLTNAMKIIIEKEQITQKDIGKLIRVTKEEYRNAVNGRMVADIAKKLLN